MKRLQPENPLNLVPPDLHHLVPGFLQRREKEVDELTLLLPRGEFEAIKDIGHRLKGTGTGYGFPLISRLGKELEEAAEAKDTDQLVECISELRIAVFTLKGFLDS